MTKDVKIYNQSSSEIDWKYLEASQQLQLDKQNYGADYIHLYVDDIEGDWLENWDWEEDLTDYIEAFYNHCEQENYQFAFDTLKACDGLLHQPENYEKCLELYSYLVERLEEATEQLEYNNQDILNEAKNHLFILENNGQGENMPEEKIIKIVDPTGSRIAYIKKLLDKAHNGVIRKTWQFEYSRCDDEFQCYWSQMGKAYTENFLVDFGVWYSDSNGGYFVNIHRGNDSKEEIANEDSYSATFFKEELDLILEYLIKIQAANWQAKSIDLDALPE